jgi:hypothetical protein
MSILETASRCNFVSRDASVRLYHTRESFMAVSVDFTPDHLDFGAISPGSSGPDITVDPTFGPPRVNFAGAVQIKNVPANANVTARFEQTSNFKVRDIIAMEWVWEEVDPGELPPGHHGPLPKVRVLEVAAQSDGQSPLAVLKGQYVLVRAEYLAPADGSTFTGTLVITGDTWNVITVPVSFFLSGISSTVRNTPIELAQGTPTTITLDVKVVAGPESDVRYEMSPTQLHAGVSITGQNQIHATGTSSPYSLTFRTALDAPLGDNNLAINQFFLNKRTAFFIPITVKPFDSIQKIHSVKIVAEPSALNFTFTTERTSRPVITIWKRSPFNDPVKEMVPDNKVGETSWTGAPQSSHSLRVAGLPVAIPMWFRIDADVEAPDIPPGAFTNYDGQTATLQRVCVVHVWRIEVQQAGGDSDGPEDGNQMDFSMMVYDGITGRQLIDPTYAKFNEVNNGDVLTTAFGDNNGLVQVPRATDVIVPYILGVSLDPDLGLGIIGEMVPPTLPSQRTSGASDSGAWADCFGSFMPPVTVGDFNSSTMVLVTEMAALVGILVKITFETIVSDPFGALTMVYPDR